MWLSSTLLTFLLEPGICTYHFCNNAHSDFRSFLRYHLEKDDLEQALRYINLLTGAPQNVAADWVKDLRVHLETVQAARAISAYAGVKAIESM